MSKRIPSLDGLRAIAASMVVLGHTCKMLEVGHHLPFGLGIVDGWGPVGVSLFFVLSGFLITKLMLEERHATGRVDLRAFYLRRTFRILPAYWTYLAVVALLAYAGAVVATPSSFARVLTFSSDYLNPHSWVVNHAWSLSVEEQFYLLWPFLVVALGVFRARKTALALIALTPLLRVAWYFALPDWRDSITAMLHLRIDALMIGCWAALELDEKGTSRVPDVLARPTVAAASAFYMLFLAFQIRRLVVVQSALGYSLEAFGALSVIFWAMRNAESAVGRVLNLKPVAHLGVLSYSLYLWQQLWLSHDTASAYATAPLKIAGALVCAELSYRFVEKPMLKLRGKVPLGAPKVPAGAAAA